MPINNITQTISELPAPPHRGVEVQTQFVIKQEDFQDHLQGTTVTELNTLKDQLNARIGEINSTATTMNGYATSASSSASTATTKAGEASTSATAALNSRNQASTFATNSSNSATKASQWADNNYTVEVETGKYSAKHWSTVAQNATVNKVDKVTSTDNAIVRFDGTTGAVQNSNVIIDDAGNVGIGISTPKARLDIYTLGISGGLPATTGSAADPNVMVRIAALAVCMDIGVEPTGQQWIQCRGLFNYSLKYDLHLQPNGGNVLVTGGGGLGYGTGSGGSVTQLTNKSTAVTLNKPTGKIIMNNAALAAGASVTFTLNNSVLTSNDTIEITLDGYSVGAEKYIIRKSVINGAAYINIKNDTTTSYSDAIVLNFTVIKGAVS